MAKVYLVTTGKWSDYGITAVFDSRELAEMFLGKISQDKYDESRIEEFELNPNEAEIRAGLSNYIVHMSRDGDSHTVESDNRAFTWTHYGLNDAPEFDCEGKMIVCVRALDAQTAVKVANERRVALIAAAQWPEPKVVPQCPT